MDVESAGKGATAKEKYKRRPETKRQIYIKLERKKTRPTSISRVRDINTI